MAKETTKDPSPKFIDKSTYYEFLEVLGEGSFGKVYKAIYKPTKEEIAVKVILGS